MQRSSENSIIISHNKVELNWVSKRFSFEWLLKLHAFQNSICVKWNLVCAFSKAHFNSNNAWPSLDGCVDGCNNAWPSFQDLKKPTVFNLKSDWSPWNVTIVIANIIIIINNYKLLLIFLLLYKWSFLKYTNINWLLLLLIIVTINNNIHVVLYRWAKFRYKHQEMKKTGILCRLCFV